MFRLGDAATPLAYEATLAIDPRAETFQGEIHIRFRINRPAPRIWMHGTDLKIESAQLRQGERDIPIRVLTAASEFIALEATQGILEAGEAVASIRYRGPLDPDATRGLFRQKESGDWYVVSQLEDDYARRAFPCFDEPGWKTPWQLTLDVPAGNVVVSNTPEKSVVATPGREGWMRHEFLPTPPLPTYLVALAIGPFDVVEGGTAGRKKTLLRYLALRGHGAEMRYAKQSTPRLVELLEEYFGTPYPFDKLDFVTIGQTVNFGAMENAGMITYVSTLLQAKPNEETATFRQNYDSVAAHEIAHMWFGDLVTAAWWDDIWLNEAFASWMSRKVTRQFNPARDDGWERNRGRSRSLFADRLPSARRIRNPVLSKGAINEAFDRITYDKGSEVLSMFEAWLGPETFRQGVRDYLRAHAYGSATSRDFFRALGAAAGKADAALAAFDTFVDQPGIPMMDATLECRPGKAPMLKLTQQRLRSAGTQMPPMKWTTPACFASGGEGPVGKYCTEVVDGDNTLKVGAVGTCPAWVTGNAGGGGHYVVRPDAALYSRVVTALPAMPEFEAVAVTQDASLLSRVGLLAPQAALVVLRRALAHPAASVRRTAIEALRVFPPEYLRGEVAQAKAALDREVVVPMAEKKGWTEHPGETDAQRELRVILLPYAARGTAGTKLRAQARTLALQWVADRGGADAMMVTPILDTAARFADEATYNKLEAEALSTARLRDRQQLLSALAKVHDPRLLARALARMVEKSGVVERVASRDMLTYLEDALEEDTSRVAAFAFVRANFDHIATKLPGDTTANLIGHLDRLCTPADRQSFVEFFRDRAPTILHGPRKYELTLEAIDICVAANPQR
ncbi:MAG: M1 family metallopeptidase [Usitatibacter sp.]